jgi:integrase
MPSIDFTKTALEKLPTPADKRAIWHDSSKKSVNGMGLLIQPNNGRKKFFWYKKVNGEPTWQTLGEFGQGMTLEEAREKAADLNTELTKWKNKKYAGPNPFKKPPDGLTLGVLFEKYYETLKTKGCSPKRGPATEKSLKDTKSWHDKHLKKRWDDRALDSIHLDRVRELHAKITKENGPVIANRVVGLLRRCVNWGIHKDLWHGENPAEKIDWNPETSRERFVQPGEMARLLEAVEKEKVANWDLHDFVLLSLFIGQRKSNTLAMRWQQITASVTGVFEWNIPVTKNGKSHRVPLCVEAMIVLQDRKKRADTKETASPWVFPSDSKTGHIKDMKNSWSRLRKAVKIPDVHIHDLRRTMGSYMAGANVSLPTIGKALGHQSIAATQIYARLQLDPVRQAMSTAIAGMKNAKEQKVLGGSHE